MAKQKEEKQQGYEAKFSKAQLQKSRYFCDSQDILEVVLLEGAEYTKKEATQKIQEFKKGRI